MPIWAPRGGRPGLVTNGHSTGAWSEAIRHTDTGADAGDQPRPGCRWPRRGTGWNSRASRSAGSAVGTVGRSWPKSASSRSTPRPAGCGAAAVHWSAFRSSPMPSGRVAAAKPASWARSSRSGANPARRMDASRRRPNSAIRRVRGTVTQATA